MTRAVTHSDTAVQRDGEKRSVERKEKESERSREREGNCAVTASGAVLFRGLGGAVTSPDSDR